MALIPLEEVLAGTPPPFNRDEVARLGSALDYIPNDTENMRDEVGHAKLTAHGWPDSICFALWDAWCKAGRDGVTPPLTGDAAPDDPPIVPDATPVPDQQPDGADVHGT